MTKLLSLLMIVSAATALAQQRGTVALSELNELLAQKPTSWNRIKTDFEVFPVVDGGRINAAQSRELTGTRVAPYQLFARPKGATGPYTHQITIETESEFFDSQGRPVPPSKAKHVREKVLSIATRRLNPSEYFTPPAR